LLSSSFAAVIIRVYLAKSSEILPLSVVIGDKGYDSEHSDVLLRDVFHAFSGILVSKIWTCTNTKDMWNNS
jgi:hypothetical protein